MIAVRDVDHLLDRLRSTLISLYFYIIVGHRHLLRKKVLTECEAPGPLCASSASSFNYLPNFARKRQDKLAFWKEALPFSFCEVGFDSFLNFFDVFPARESTDDTIGRYRQ